MTPTDKHTTFFSRNKIIITAKNVLRLMSTIENIFTDFSSFRIFKDKRMFALSFYDRKIAVR